MKKIFVIVLLILCVGVCAASADCPAINNIDDPPCGCPYTVTGSWSAEFDYEDSSRIFGSGDILTDCDGDDELRTAEWSYWCPNGPDDEQCIARQHYFGQ